MRTGRDVVPRSAGSESNRVGEMGRSRGDKQRGEGVRTRNDVVRTVCDAGHDDVHRPKSNVETCGKRVV